MLHQEVRAEPDELDRLRFIVERLQRENEQLRASLRGTAKLPRPERERLAEDVRDACWEAVWRTRGRERALYASAIRALDLRPVLGQNQ